MSIVYVQARPSGEPLNVNCYAAWQGFTELGHDVRRFSLDEMKHLELSRETVVHGNIGTVWAAWRQIGVPKPPYMNVPAESSAFTGRRMWETTLGDIRRLDSVPVFIKPLTQGKAFTGHVVRQFRDLLETCALPDNYPVLAQEPIDLVSEWRVFVLKHEIIGIGHYKGDPLVFPDRDQVRAVLTAYSNPVIAHSMDFGVLDDGTTVLIELNDGYALGSYGLSPVRYARMVKARWCEVCSDTAGDGKAGEETGT